MNKLKQLQKALRDKVAELENSADDAEKFEALEKECAGIEAEIERLKRANAKAASLAVPAGVTKHEWAEEDREEKALGALPVPKTPTAQDGGFKSLGEMLTAVYAYSVGGDADNRLIRAPTGMGENPASAGGFLVQTDFAQAIQSRIYDIGAIMGRVDKGTISTNANGIKIPAVDESSRATGSRFGGVQTYWIAEGEAPTASRPTFRLLEFDLKKLGALYYVSDELMQDAALLSQFAMNAFSQEILFAQEDAIIRGNGVGKPTGLLNSNALVTVAKETGQAAASVVYDNILNMWARMWGRSRLNAVWLINQDVEPQLQKLQMPGGVSSVPVMLPPGGASGQPYSTIFGRPVIPVEYASTLGTVGDIMLVDLSQYLVMNKGGVQAASSMHVRFLQDEMVFRMLVRLDGKSKWNSALTPYQGTNTQSPFVALATRA